MLVPKKDVAEDSKYVCGLLTGEDIMLSSHFHSPPHLGSNRYSIVGGRCSRHWVQPHPEWLAGLTARIDKILKIRVLFFTNCLIC